MSSAPDGWRPATRRRRLAAWLVDLTMFGTTVGLGWSVWAWRCWDRGTTPGKYLLGLTVFSTVTSRSGTQQPADRSLMAARTLGYQGLAALLGLATLGLGWLYCVAPALGPGRRTIYDDWSRTAVLQRTIRLGGPAGDPARSRRRAG